MKYEYFSALIESGLSTKHAVSLSGVAYEADFEILKLAIEVGAPLAQVSKALARHQDALKAFEREIQQALAIPVATRRLMIWLPVIGLVLSELLGLGSLAALSTTLGLVGFLVGLSLMYLGARATQRLLDQAKQNTALPSSGWFRFGILISVGMPLSQAKQEASPLNDPEGLIDLALSTGASLGELVKSKQNSELASFAAERISSAKALSVSLLVPLGLTMLPAFLIFTVLPMVIGINQQ